MIRAGICIVHSLFLLCFTPSVSGWYGCGGRMKPGESMFDAARRLLLRELKLDLSVSALQARLHTVGSYSFLWGKREQLPQTNGTADISTVVTLDLSDAEVAALKPHEFGEASQWVEPAEVLDVARGYHAALQRSMSDYIKLKRFQQLDALLLGGVPVAGVPEHPAPAGAAKPLAAGADAAKLSDAQLLEQVRAFFQYQRFISANDTQTIQCPETQ